MKYLLALLFPLAALAQSPDGTFKTLTATMPSADAYAITEPLPYVYDSREKFIVVFPSPNTTTTPTLNRGGLGAKLIKNENGVSPAIGSICACRKILSYTGTYFQIVGDAGSYTGASPTTVTVGGLTAGSSISGQNFSQIIQSIVAPYVNPVFTSFSVTGQATTIEVGTTLSGSKTFTWGITVNSGVVPTIDIYDNTGSSTLLAGTPNDGTQATTVTTRQLNSSGATQSWKGIGNNTSPSSTFNSSNFVVTAAFYQFYGASASTPTNSSQVRALPTSLFYTSTNTFILNTGSSLTKFDVALPPGVSITQVLDLDALSANITSQYVSTSTIGVLDAGGTSRSYTLYEMNIGSAYSSNHRHQITTN